ncbi:nucleotidyltransferase [Mycobacterium phage DirkDirk]|uniref:Nucleotidyltransferase n=1 Tax=Mycobacterium phage DirkDirk TaxID=2664225 RepID=A0A5Q2WEM2_9CAUD|nr:nucleotidyltransferase [Mycobacterium phage DirkDirk]QGH75143.1 nucleotidyltransferase [Mycobacterium phage DirkDirk]
MDMQPLIIGEIGSFAHGLNREDSDHDYIGIYADPPEALIGLKPLAGAIRDRDKPEGVKSEPGDSETQFYGLRKYVSLVCQGNPTVMTLLFTPNLRSPDMIGLQANARMFLSKRLAARHMGYADSMYARLTGKKAPRTNRPELIAKHGYDTKAAFHAVRLLMQGHEMLITHNMVMPMIEQERGYLLSIRNGEVPEAEVLREIEHWRSLIQAAEQRTTLPDGPDMERINAWLVGVHRELWGWNPILRDKLAA